DVQDRGLGVERRTAPFRATVQAWEHDGALKACRDELAAAPHRPEALQHGAMRVRRTLREHVFAEPLAREWLRGERERLRIGGHLAFDVGLRVAPVCDREERLPGYAVEQEHVAGLGDLRDGV